jgi:cation transport regulator ChaC
MWYQLRRRVRHAWVRATLRSWTLARARYRRHGVDLQGRPGESIWYFAYGANLHRDAFRGRRKMQPSEWRVGRIAGYRLRFNLDGRPKGRTAPANIEADPAAEVWGVLYKITRRDLVWLDTTEGFPGYGYRHLWVEAEDGDGNAVPCVAYLARGKAEDGRPSQRYLTLIRDGARDHGLPAHWLAHLDTVRHADEP